MPARANTNPAVPGSLRGAAAKSVAVVVPKGWKPKKRGYCIHDRQKSKCKDCGGASVCVHGRRKRQCKECGGAGICPHGRQRSQCKECGGASICEHGRRRSNCKECGGSQICGHGRERSKCKDCGGKSMCEHGRVKSQCRTCKGGTICEHGRRRTQCKECGGAGLCEHNKQRSRCAVCKRPKPSLSHLGEDAIAQVRPAAGPSVPAVISNPIEPAERNPRENEDPIVPDVPLGVATTEPPHVEPRAESPESLGEIVRQESGSVDESGRRVSENEVTRYDRVDRIGVLCPHRKFASECAVCIGAGILAALNPSGNTHQAAYSPPEEEAEADKDNSAATDPAPSTTPSSPKSPKARGPPSRATAMAMDSLFEKTFRR